MSRRSIRARLAGWYLAVLLLATSGFGAGSWMLLKQSVVRDADNSLRARVDDVRAFIEQASRTLARDEFLDEFGEYAKLTPGDALLEVRDETGLVLCRPRMTGWDAMSPGPTDIVLADRILQGNPFRVIWTTVDVDRHRYSVVAATPLRSALDTVSDFGWILAVMVPVVVLVGGTGGYLISRRALAPVDRFSDAVQAITLERLSRRLEVPTADLELRRLAVTFNDTLARLESAVSEMARLTAEASHELRTPVALIRTTAELALSRDQSTEEHRQSLADVLEQAERLSTLVDDLLTLARADAGVEPSVRAPVDVAAVIEEHGRSVQAAMAQQSLAFDIEVRSRPIVQGAAQALGRLALILFDNAMKYTPAGGTVRVSVDQAPNEHGVLGAVVEVTDSGIGIDPADQSRVFDRFYRGAAARAAAPDGTGLGLSIAKVIVLKHGGEIALNGGKGGGVGVRVWLPFGTNGVFGTE